jgi:MFS family permease
VSAYFLVGIFVSPCIGLLADRIGRKRVLVPALGIFSLTGPAGYVAPDYLALLVLRGIQGTAAALFVTTVTVVDDLFEDARRNASLGANIAVLSVGAAVFPTLGGALAAVAWNAPFLMYALGLPVALFALWVLEDAPSGHRGRSPPGKFQPQSQHVLSLGDQSVTRRCFRRFRQPGGQCSDCCSQGNGGRQ